MKNSLQKPMDKLQRLSGLDSTVSAALLQRGLQGATAFITLFFIAKRLSPVEQGYFYTFSSLLGTQLFLDLGLTIVIVQFASHEKAYLTWSDQGTLEGDPAARSRLSTVLRFSLIWFGAGAALMLLLFVPAGCYFFSSSSSPTDAALWKVPWVWLGLVVASSLTLSPLLPILEGCGKIRQVALYRTCQDLLANVGLWSGLGMGMGLLAVPLFQTTKFICDVIWLFINRRPFLNLLATQSKGTFSWLRDVWPFHWRIAFCTVSGYLIYQMFSPVLFRYSGATVAGQMGMSMAFTMGLSGLAMTWVTAKVPLFGELIIKREAAVLDAVFFRSSARSLIAMTVMTLLFWTAAAFLHLSGHPLSQRILSPFPLALLIASTLANHVVFCEAAYLRVHKEEPLWVLSLLQGLATTCSTIFLGKDFGIVGINIGYLATSLVLGLGCSTRVFLASRRLWYPETASSRRTTATT